MLTQTELDLMRTDFDRSLPDEAEIYRKVFVSDGQGGRIEAPNSPALIGTFPARLSPNTMSDSEKSVAEKLTSEQTWILTLPVSTPIELTDTVRVRFLETLEQKVLEISAIIDPRTYNIATRVLATEVK